MNRCYKQLSESDLVTIRDSAWPEFERFLGVGAGKYEVFRGRLIAMCLCQGAAQHYVDGSTGVKDVDIYFFFEEHPDVKIPHQRNCRKSRQADTGACGARRFDLMKKQVPANLVEPDNPAATLVNYLTQRDTRNARKLATQAVVGLEPDSVFGDVIWPREVP